MDYREVTEKDHQQYNHIVNHPLQSWEWGEFRKKTGVTVIRRLAENHGKAVIGFQVTIHPIPHTPYTIGYFPKGMMPDDMMLKELTQIGHHQNCLFIKLEPEVEKNKPLDDHVFQQYHLEKSAHPLFTRFTFELDLSKSEEELLQQMSQKTRYNVRLAQKKGVTVSEESSTEAFNAYLHLVQETTRRQGFYAHDETYHRNQWQMLGQSDANTSSQKIAHLFTARYQEKILVAWIVFLFHDVLYYPYGASSDEHRDVMASNLVMWEVMKWGKAHGAKRFDLWGALGPDPDPQDPWYGFHRFKQGYGPRQVEWMGSYDLVLHPWFYRLYSILHQVRWFILRHRK